MDSGHAAARGMTCGLAGFLLVLLLVSFILVPAGACRPPGRHSDGLASASDDLALADGAAEIASAPVADTDSDGPSSAGPADGVDQDSGSADARGSGDDGTWLARLSQFDNLLPFGIPVLLIPGRVRKERLLEQPLRREIVEAVRKHPGIHHRELLRTLGVSNGTLAYHLRLLERGGYLQASRAHGRKLLWVPDDEVDVELLLLTSRDREFLEILAHVSMARIEDLGRRTGLKPSSVEYHLSRLRGLGVVWAWREGHALVFARVPGHLSSQGLYHK